MSTSKVTLIAAALWGVAFIVTALLFKGDRLGDWIQGALLVGFITHLSRMGARGSRCRNSVGGRS